MNKVIDNVAFDAPRPLDLAGGPGLPPPRRDDGGPDKQPQRLPLSVYRVAMIAGLAAILMMFAGLVSAFVVRGMASGWKPVELPKSLWVSTLLLLASSFTLENARRACRAEDYAGYRTMLAVTTALGLAFIVAQLLSWAALVAQGVYLQGSPHSSFFYLFTGLHGVHVLGGLVALGWLVRDARRGVPSSDWDAKKRLALADTAALYWHFMDGLWVCLFALLLLWR